MIGWIALAGIIVRNSILLVDFTVQEYARGVPFFDAVVNSCASRTRPIMITAFALVGGASVILLDPIFQGMAISLLFGVLVSTVLTLIVIPLGTLSAGEESCRNIAVSMGLLPGDANADEKYNIIKESKSKSSENKAKPKNWIKAALTKKTKEADDAVGVKETTNSVKIDTNGLLKKEDKNDL